MISVILSTNNELKNNYLKQVLEWIKNQDVKTELIVVDNGSTDGTFELCEKYGKVITLKNSNRAERLNKWLEYITWNIVLFHHSVSILPKNTFSNIITQLEWTKIRWWYSHSFDIKHFLLRFTSWYSNNIRAKRKWILYLDHMIFARTEFVKKIWWFPKIDIFEDTVFSEKMRKYSKPLLLQDTITTSARRFIKRGIWKQAFLNQYLKIMFYIWRWDKTINKIYEEKEWFNVNYK